MSTWYQETNAVGWLIITLQAYAFSLVDSILEPTASPGIVNAGVLNFASSVHRFPLTMAMLERIQALPQEEPQSMLKGHRYRALLFRQFG
jgi:hypothetical protein